MRILFLEPKQAHNFSPIALARPVFELLCGTRSVRERIVDLLCPDSWGVMIRDYLQDVYLLEHPSASVNNPEWINEDEIIIVNGLWIGDPRLLLDLSGSNSVLYSEGEVVARYFTPHELMEKNLLSLEELQSLFDTRVFGDNSDKKNVSCGPVLNYPWELIKQNAEAIKLDFELFDYKNRSTLLSDEIAQTAMLPSDGEANIFISSEAELESFVSINSSQGPVIVEQGAVIQSFTRLEGPCFIGANTQLFRANIRQETSIGPVCRVGGEIEGSIIHGYANKYHDGFLGHSYVCPWVNLGALTTNSDLKNDYSDVSVPLNGEYLDTGEKKIGCFIGDHAKTAIGTLFNTGSHVGVMATVLPAGKLCPKYIPSFSRLWHGERDAESSFEALCETASTAMQRRGCEFAPVYRQMFEVISTKTVYERTLLCK